MMGKNGESRLQINAKGEEQPPKKRSEKEKWH